ncbi:2-hydroxy-3-keto-5-methylthiopentenyl-1-phosphate phosphatase [Paenibacillus sp. FJAT-26967]|uniref:2-hydroxy-3-keto-5-methylthiopentenyl-1- phosphate phosphatase n=1 Tax=Paenibacillus sp. FJAT-26967 TaxID=1729690 RepID=UPI000838761F|nr:2-hydroxy-3-keto-5-methylthiopentenyl-1-phosphate phosphatase [Paenibacillus sp. FJAT-26967]
MLKQKIIFCDFDGTITKNDNIVAIMKHFNPPGWEEIVNRLLQERAISVRQAVGEMFHLLPSSLKEEVVHFAISNAAIRDGFDEFVTYCKQKNIKLLVTSGGIDFFVYPLLQPFDIPQDDIFCNASSFDGETIEILWPHVCDDVCVADCGMCKTTIIRSYPEDQYERILIGDSITDFQGAKLVETVYARAQLIDLCQELDRPYHPFETFHDIIRDLEATTQA